MSIFALLSLSAAAVALFIGSYVFSKNPHGALNRLFLLLSVALCYLSFAEFGYRQADTADETNFWLEVGSFWPLGLAFLLHFVLVFAERPKLLSSPLTYLWHNIAYAAKFVKLANRKNNLGGNIGRALKGIASAFRASYGYMYRAEYTEVSGRRNVVKAWWEIDSLGPDRKPNQGSPAWVVQRVFTWIGAEEKTLHWAAKELNSLGIPAAFGSSWNPGKLQRLVRKPWYTGKHAYNVNARVPSLDQPLTDITSEIKRNRKQPKPESEWVYFDVPVLVDESLWQRANDLLTARGRGRGKEGKSINALLRGRIYCPGCQQPMVVRRHTRNRERVYYHCKKYGQSWRSQPCTYSKFIPASWDQVVWADLSSLLRDDAWLDAGIDEAQREDRAVQKLVHQQETKIAQAHSKRLKVQEGFEGGIYTLEQAKSRIMRFESDIGQAEEEIERLLRRSGSVPRSNQELSALKEELRVLRDRNLDEAIFQHRVDLVARLGVRVFPSEDLKTMRVKCRLSVDDGPDDAYAVGPTKNPLDPMPANMERESADGCEKVPSAPPSPFWEGHPYFASGSLASIHLLHQLCENGGAIPEPRRNSFLMTTPVAPPKRPQTKPAPKPAPRVRPARKTDPDPFNPDWPDARPVPEPKG